MLLIRKSIGQSGQSCKTLCKNWKLRLISIWKYNSVSVSVLTLRNFCQYYNNAIFGVSYLISHIWSGTFAHHIWSATFALITFDIIWWATFDLSHLMSHILSVTFDLPHFISHIWYVTFYLSHLICHIWSVTFDMSHFISHIWSVTFYQSHLMCNISSVTFDMAHLISHIWYATFDVIWSVTFVSLKSTDKVLNIRSSKLSPTFDCSHLICHIDHTFDLLHLICHIWYASAEHLVFSRPVRQPKSTIFLP